MTAEPVEPDGMAAELRGTHRGLVLVSAAYLEELEDADSTVIENVPVRGVPRLEDTVSRYTVGSRSARKELRKLDGPV